MTDVEIRAKAWEAIVEVFGDDIDRNAPNVNSLVELFAHKLTTERDMLEAARGIALDLGWEMPDGTKVGQ